MSKWIAEFDLEDGDTMPEHMDLSYNGAKLDFHCKPLTEVKTEEDCVSRKNILESLNGAFPSTDWNKALFRKIVLDTPSVYPKSDKPIGKWMSVNEALPDEPSESVLVCDIDGDIYKAYLSDYDGWRRSEDFEKVKSVRAWQPLPAPYKGEQE